MRRLLLFALLFSALHVAAAEVRVFAAVSLTEALQEIARGYTRDTIVFNFGASSMLARQIQLGAPADLFLSADEEKMDGSARTRAPRSPATRRSILRTPSWSSCRPIRARRSRRKRPRALRGYAPWPSPSRRRCRPASTPGTTCGKRALERVSDRVVPTENVRAALAAVESGNVDAGIVYKTDARIAKRVRVAFEVPRAEGPAISYPFARAAPTRRGRRRPGGSSPTSSRRPRWRCSARYGFLISATEP